MMFVQGRQLRTTTEKVGQTISNDNPRGQKKDFLPTPSNDFLPMTSGNSPGVGHSSSNDDGLV
ncbi:hypothetical protein PanWU01x14_270110 [Parasponia andersonii]|uniref:Uncharacterized protein n=1 Tax=Parasponia andersonii TaxID=3476 RepID=A0A2P5B5B2_PARAD|nr:hypothetical protein PanWU01x14_270110 [Parasponia andersonii]